jgi:hypothetical protein
MTARTCYDELEMLLIITLVFSFGTIAGLLIGRLLPPRVQRAIIITLSLLLAAAHIYLAGQQLATSGFVGRTRSPDYFSYYLGYGLVLVGLLNVWLCFKSRPISATLLAAMIILLPVFYFATW